MDARASFESILGVVSGAPQTGDPPGHQEHEEELPSTHGVLEGQPRVVAPPGTQCLHVATD